jgi:hypothetical protein
MTDDKRLERLYDYTKFHIGIYLSVAAGLAGVISLAADKDKKLDNILRLIHLPWAFGAAFLAMVVAGIAGALVATTAIRAKTYEDFKDTERGPCKAECWVSIEHYSFWVSLGFIALGVLTSKDVWSWIISCTS